jgi:undecaprenyl-diphosphatase
LALVLFVLVSLASRGTNTLDIDLSVSEWVQDRNGAWADPLAHFGNFIGEAKAALGILAAALIWALATRKHREIWYLLFAAIGRLLGTVFKELLDSPRPSAEHVTLAEVFNGFGFPSGHTMTSAITVGSAAFLLARSIHSPRGRLLLLAGWMLGIACTAFGRIWFGAHWFSDTVGGAAYGIAVVLIAANLSAMVTSWRSGSSRTAPVQSPER